MFRLKKNIQQDTFYVLHCQINAAIHAIHAIKVSKRDGSDWLEKIGKDRLSQLVHVANEMYRGDLITYEQYKELCYMESNFYKWEKENESWVDKIVYC